MKEFPYINDKFLDYTCRALKDHFSSKKEFNNYYNAIKTDKDKNLFLKTASFYLFLVKSGHWNVAGIPDSSTEINYLTISYQFIAIVSLIESLSTSNHSSTRKFINFCQALSLNRQRALVSKYTNKLPVLGSFVAPPDEEIPKHLEILAKDLYGLRSKFVHKAELPLPLVPGTTVSFLNNKLVVCNLSIKDIMEFFEEGLLIHFQKGP